jgi:hypothetical protein
VRILSVVVFLIGGASACAETHADFQPYSSTSRGYTRVMRIAILAYEGDIPTLIGAGGEIVGTLSIGGNGYADSNDVRYRAVEQAAAVGGTHLLIAREGSSLSLAQVTPDRATTTVYGNTATTTYTPGAQVPINRPNGRYVVVRVPPQRWSELPTTLRPVAGQHYQGRPVVARRVTGAPGASVRVTGAPGASVMPQSRASSWFCTNGSTPDFGLCVRSFEGCEKALVDLKQYGATACTSATEATCFSWKTKNAEPAMLSCHPSLAACRRQHDYAFGQGGIIARECTPIQ